MYTTVLLQEHCSQIYYDCQLNSDGSSLKTMIHLPAEISFISVLVLTWAGNDCDYLGWAGREWPETAESVFKSEPELRSGNNKNWCDLVTGGLGMVMVTMTPDVAY